MCEKVRRYGFVMERSIRWWVQGSKVGLDSLGLSPSSTTYQPCDLGTSSNFSTPLFPVCVYLGRR